MLSQNEDLAIEIRLQCSSTPLKGALRGIYPRDVYRSNEKYYYFNTLNIQEEYMRLSGMKSQKDSFSVKISIHGVKFQNF
jgi:hypothetical protein